MPSIEPVCSAYPRSSGNHATSMRVPSAVETLNWRLPTATKGAKPNALWWKRKTNVLLLSGNVSMWLNCWWTLTEKTGARFYSEWKQLTTHFSPFCWRCMNAPWKKGNILPTTRNVRMSTFRTEAKLWFELTLTSQWALLLPGNTHSETPDERRLKTCRKTSLNVLFWKSSVAQNDETSGLQVRFLLRNTQRNLCRPFPELMTYVDTMNTRLFNK